MLVKIETIKINERMREVSEDKVTEIASSIKEIGLLNPITISDKNELIAGLHRLNAFKLLGYAEIEANVVPLSGLKQELAEIDENLIRHDLHYIDRGDYLKRRKEIYELLHPETKQGQYGHKGNEIIEKPENEIISFSEDTASKTGLSSRTIQQEVQMATNLTPEMKQQVKKADLSKTEALKLARLEPEKQKQVMEKAISGKDKIDNVIKEIKKEERQEEKRQQQLAPTKEMPKNEFEVILADPPWRYDFSSTESREIENQYPTMELEDICKLNVPAAKDCILFLWATAPKLREALKVVDAWGFEYKTHAIWDKQKIGMGYYFRGQHELLLVATKGELRTPLPETRPASIFSSLRTNHSEKPDIVYEIIEKMYPNKNYLEMFARKERNNWKSWGNEL